MTDTTISSGQSSAGFGVNSGDTLTILSGGTATAAQVQSGGTVYLYGTDSGSTLSGSETIYAGGVASGVLDSYGSQTISSGGIASGTVISWGAQYVSDGGVTTGTVLYRNSNEYVYSGGTAIGTVVSSTVVGRTAVGGSLNLSGGTSVDAIVLSKGNEVVSSGVASHTTVSAGGILAINGGKAINTVISATGSASLVGSGAIMSNTTVQYGNLTVASGIASDTVITGGNIYVNAGGQLLNAVMSGGIISAGDAGTLVSGLTLTANPASTGQAGHASMTILSGAVASDTQLINGAITSDGNNTKLTIVRSGTAVHTTVYTGATEVVSSAGSAVDTVLSGGRLVINDQYAIISGIEVHSGGSIDVNYLTYNAADTVNVTSGGLLTVTSAGSTVYTTQLTGTYTGDYFHATADTDGSLILTEDNTPCYCPGTLIATDKGEVLVEDLVIGDRVLTHKGEARAIKWIGHRAYSGRFAAMNREIMPICFKAGSIADNTPRRDLWVSPHHAFYLNGVLIEARDLVNGVSIYQASSVNSVKYFHVELDSHDVIIAEGALAESFVDDNGRGIFHNAHEYAALYTDAEAAAVLRYYAPRVDCGEEVEAARAALDARAEAHFGVALKSVA